MTESQRTSAARDLFKSRPVARVKAITDADEPGTFEAVVSVFGNVDSDGEVVMPGAFTKTLAAGLKPIVFSHDWMSVPIGQTLEAKETSEGLVVKGRLFVAPDEDHARAREVYAAMRAGALTEFSFGGKVTVETRREDDAGVVTYELNEIDLVEYGPCLKGANPATRLLAVKSMVQAGVVTREEARSALGIDAGKSEDDGAADAPVDDAPVDEGPDDAPADDAQADDAKPAADDGWSQTLAAVRAGVLTTAEARVRLGLPAAQPDGAPEPEPEPAGSPHAQALAQLDVAA
jgi:HK97 family phage prohead protease